MTDRVVTSAACATVAGPRLTVAGAAGGCGTTTVAALAGIADAGRWSNDAGHPLPSILVCRPTRGSVTRARDIVQSRIPAPGRRPPVLVVMGDGATTRDEVRAEVEAVGRQCSAVVWLPFVPGWRDIVDPLSEIDVAPRPFVVAFNELLTAVGLPLLPVPASGRHAAGSRTWSVRPRRGLAATSPRGDTFAPPPADRCLPVHSGRLPVEPGSGWVFVSAHGGCGASLLARLSTARQSGKLDESAAGAAAGPSWPDPALGDKQPVVVVARSSMQGLLRARDVAAQWLSGTAPGGVAVLGLVTVADAPGRAPRQIEASRRLLAGAYPRVWTVPWVEQYRFVTADDPCPEVHPAITRVFAAIRSLTAKEN